MYPRTGAVIFASDATATKVAMAMEEQRATNMRLREAAAAEKAKAQATGKGGSCLHSTSSLAELSRSSHGMADTGLNRREAIRIDLDDVAGETVLVTWGMPVRPDSPRANGAKTAARSTAGGSAQA